RVERSDGAVHIDGRAPIERQVHVLFVLVLPEEPARARGRRRRDERQRRHNPHHGNDIVKISPHSCPPGLSCISSTAARRTTARATRPCAPPKAVCCATRRGGRRTRCTCA